jgi:hypothetical protein
MDLLNGCSVCITADTQDAVPYPQNSSYLPTLIKKISFIAVYLSKHSKCIFRLHVFLIFLYFSFFSKFFFVYLIFSLYFLFTSVFLVFSLPLISFFIHYLIYILLFFVPLFLSNSPTPILTSVFVGFYLLL